MNSVFIGYLLNSEIEIKMEKSLREMNASNLMSKTATVVAGILVAAMLCAVLFLVYHNPASKSDFEGTIVDRWADYAESEQGSTPRLRLVVESQDGKRLTVKVDPNIYNSAKVGMRIKSRAGQIVLINSERSSAGGK